MEGTQMQFTLNIARPAHSMRYPANASSGGGFSFRTDCQAHGDQIRAMLYPWLARWTETSTIPPSTAKRSPPFNMNSGMFVEVQFELEGQAPSLAEVRWLIRHLAECEFAAETLDITARYTGARQADKLELYRPTPPRAVVNMAMRALRQFQERLEDSATQAARAWQALEESLKRGLFPVLSA
jgi:hypothetical protein